MIPYITLGVTLFSLAATLFLLWILAVPHQEEEPTNAIGFQYTPIEIEEPEDGC